jgi:dihydrodipicolinate synthase/N-acetylneuraminate lyase
MLTKISGIVGTPVTPFTADNRVDAPTLQRIVDFLIRNGAQAIGLPMHIGESINMSVEERQLVARLAVEAAAGRVPVFVNPSLAGTDQVIALARHAESIGAQGLVVISPYHWQPARAALVDHFASVAGAVGISLIAYNYPERIGVTLTPDLVLELIDRCPNLVGLKDAGINMEYFTEMCRVTSVARPGFSVFTGVEYFLPGMAVGGVGAFSACGGVAPRLVKAVYDACAAGDYARARPLQYKLSHLFNVIKVDYPSGIKAAMALMGRAAGPTRKPIPSLDPSALRRLQSELEKLGILSEEPHGW